ncbi:restriction system-associated AAA family ATPase [Dyadobacter sp. BHUBP1]|uniref:restriction system-associated AAA family ATPase n=1 Tax=Dyadobacter sp. BHUBP1 TaxID=3424178 RepID=UPI003D32C0E1
MRITQISIGEIPHRPLMAGLELFFSKPVDDFINANCLIGINGSGKSQFLETIAEIFLYLDKEWRTVNVIKNDNPALTFRIEYKVYINGNEFSVSVDQPTFKRKDLKLMVTDLQKNEINVDDAEKYKFLPAKIVGYTSGENETLSSPFLSYYDEYASYTANRGLKGLDTDDYTPRFYFMDYNTNLGIAISNLIFEEFNGLTALKKELKIDSIHSFQIVIQTRQPAAPTNVKSTSGETGVVLTKELKEWREQLVRCATQSSYEEKYDRHVLDFFIDEATREAIKHYFKTTFNFYTVLYKFELLNNLIVDKTTRNSIERDRKARRLVKKMPEVPDKDKVMNYAGLKLRLANGEVVDYLSLSDGEHQFINIFGTLLMTNHDNTLFLLDEPETHFNPIWRRLFISNLRKITERRRQDLYITSHSPFIVSDMVQEKVYIFERVNKAKVAVRHPTNETFGSSFNNILKMAFAMEETISKEGSDFIDKLLKSDDVDEIERGIEQIGDSPRLMTLYRRIDLLKNS